ncbi:MAG: chemotaxis protein CheV [Gammaproteobacteria bacterium]|nr:chemotaxis protein CheV [Gammaproteobacteria bacterium]
MASVLESVDRLTRLVGQNRLELLLFRLATNQLYGINVFKVREVVHSPPLRRFPLAHPLVAGLARVRGVTVPVLDVATAIGLPPLTQAQSRYIVLTEFSRSLQGLAVSDIERIVNAGWDSVRPPPTDDPERSHVTAITYYNDALVQILDVERLLDLVIGPAPGVSADVAHEARLALDGKPRRALVADDSAVARNQIRRALEDIGVEAILCNDGSQALERLTRWADEGDVDEHISMVISDIEMPQMDGYTLVREIRKNRRLAHLHVMMHSSLSGQFNSQACKAAGADRLLAKFAPDEFARAVTAYLGGDRSRPMPD